MKPQPYMKFIMMTVPKNSKQTIKTTNSINHLLLPDLAYTMTVWEACCGRIRVRRGSLTRRSSVLWTSLLTCVVVVSCVLLMLLSVWTWRHGPDNRSTAWPRAQKA